MVQRFTSLIPSFLVPLIIRFWRFGSLINTAWEPHTLSEHLKVGHLYAVCLHSSLHQMLSHGNQSFLFLFDLHRTIKNVILLSSQISPTWKSIRFIRELCKRICTLNIQNYQDIASRKGFSNLVRKTWFFFLLQSVSRSYHVYFWR